VIAAPALALVVSLLGGSPAPSPPSIDMVRAAWRPSDAALLDRHGEVLHERRIDPTRRRLAWTVLGDVSPALVTAVLASEDWCIGFSHRYTVGVWVGNFSGAPMRNVSGVTGAAPVWVDVMTALHRATPSQAPAPPPGVVAARVAFAGAVEPPRHDWFLHGTEPLTVSATVSAHRARIVAPVADTIIAIDPEIPRARQRVAFEAAGGESGLRWVLDGVELGLAPGPLLWEPRPGRHTLALRDAEAQLRDTVTFEVRGRATWGAQTWPPIPDYLNGGPDMAPIPPNARSAPAQPGRSSMPRQAPAAD
jgi:membrane peptidoglycan carboxypeptidase